MHFAIELDDALVHHLEHTMEKIKEYGTRIKDLEAQIQTFDEANVGLTLTLVELKTKREDCIKQMQFWREQKQQFAHQVGKLMTDMFVRRHALDMQKRELKRGLLD